MQIYINNEKTNVIDKLNISNKKQRTLIENRGNKCHNTRMHNSHKIREGKV